MKAIEALAAVALKARSRLAGTNVMGQKLDLPLVQEIDAALKAYREEQRAEIAQRAEIRRLAEERKAKAAAGNGA